MYIYKSVACTALTVSLLAGLNCPGFAYQFNQTHPRQAEVNSRSAYLNQRTNNNIGHLDGNYTRLENRDQSIMRQEQRDVAANGGYITRGEQAQLNREENGLSRQINRDNQLGSAPSTLTNNSWQANQLNTVSQSSQPISSWQPVNTSWQSGQFNPGWQYYPPYANTSWNYSQPYITNIPITSGYPLPGMFSNNMYGLPWSGQAEVWDRAAGLDRELRSNYSNLAGNFGELHNQVEAIKQEERTLASQNGGVLTAPQQQLLNRRENNVQQQINRNLRRR